MFRNLFRGLCFCFPFACFVAVVPLIRWASEVPPIDGRPLPGALRTPYDRFNWEPGAVVYDSDRKRFMRWNGEYCEEIGEELVWGVQPLAKTVPGRGN